MVQLPKSYPGTFANLANLNRVNTGQVTVTAPLAQPTTVVSVLPPGERHAARPSGGDIRGGGKYIDHLLGGEKYSGGGERQTLPELRRKNR